MLCLFVIGDFFILFVIGDFVWSGLRKKIEDLGCSPPPPGGGDGGGGGCGCG